MIYTKNTRKAIIIAYNAHINQKDRSGLPYILHPIHLAEQMDTEEECIVALLHDVVEDTFSTTIIDALKLLTHDKDTDYFEYIERIKTNPLAVKVKLADLKHNSDETRLENITEKDIARNKKYIKAIKMLSK